jgi:hypothetical protein
VKKNGTQVYYGKDPYVLSFTTVSWLVPYLFSQRYTTLKGRSGLVQAVLIGGPGAIVIAIVVAAVWLRRGGASRITSPASSSSSPTRRSACWRLRRTPERDRHGHHLAIRCDERISFPSPDQRTWVPPAVDTCVRARPSGNDWTTTSGRPLSLETSANPLPVRRELSFRLVGVRLRNGQLALLPRSRHGNQVRAACGADRRRVPKTPYCPA